MVTEKKTLQPVVETEPKKEGEKSLKEQNEELKLKIENDKLKLEHGAYQAKFKTAEEYQKTLAQVYELQEQNKAKELELAEREKVIESREKVLSQLKEEAEKAIADAEILKPLGDDREKIKQTLLELRDKVKELVDLPDAFAEYNKYGIEKEFDKLYVEVMALIKTWNDTVNECRKRWR